MKFFICKLCGNIVEIVRESGAPLSCCGQNMTELVANTTDAAHEKHVPVVTQEDRKVIVNVGSVDHPMTEQHYIQWVAVETKAGVQRKALKPGEAPHAEFALTEGDELVAVYAYCNLHGLWKA